MTARVEETAIATQLHDGDEFARLIRAVYAEPHWVWQIETFQTDADQAAFIARMTIRAPATGPEGCPGLAPLAPDQMPARSRGSARRLL